MDSKVTYRQQVSFCGKPQCRKCREGIGHGPYWYAYHTSEQGRMVRTYVGKRLPAGVQGSQITQIASTAQTPQATQAPQVVQTTQKTRTSDVQDKHLAEAQKVDTLLALADERIAQEAFSLAIEPLDRLIGSNPTNEAAVQRLIFVLARLKRRGEAIRAYQKFVAALQQRHHSEPSTATRSLFEAIQRGDEPLVMPSVGTDLSRPQSLSRSHPLPDDVIFNDEKVVGVQGNEEADAINRSLRGQYAEHVGRSHPGPLVGREVELARMREYVFTTVEERNSIQSMDAVGAESATYTGYNGDRKGGPLPLDTRRHPQWMLLQGEAGIGKTRLVEEVGAEAQQRGWGMIWSRMYAQESSIPYRQWIEILRNAALQGLWQLEEIQQQPEVFVPLGVLLPELYDNALPRHQYTPSLSPQQEQQRLWEAVLTLFTLMSQQRPLLVVLDDLQWADSSSCELLGYLARRLSGQHVLFIGACRESELAPNHVLHGLIAHMQREHTITTLAIQPLTDAQIRKLVGHLPQDIVVYIQQQAAGNPFFAEELALSSDTELPASPNGKQSATRRKPSTLPENIRVALDHRISKLSRSCQQLLANAAVMGGSFEFSLIRAMESYGANQKDEDTILDLLDEALQAGVLAEEGRGTHIRYHFWHPLLVSHLYERLSATKRALLHRRVAEILQQLYARREEEGAATITYHLVEGGAEDERIAHYAELAGNSAYTLSAYPDAERYYRLALEHSPNALTDSTWRALLLERLGECARIQGHFEDAQHFYEQILAKRGERSKNANLAVKGSPEEQQYEAQIEALLWCEVGWTCYYTGDKTRAIACRERGEQVLLIADVARGAAWATLRYQQGLICWQEGNYDEAYAAASEAQRLFEETLRQQKPPDGRDTFSTRIRRTLAGDPVDLARIHRLLGSIANSVGRPTDGLTHLNTALTILEEHEQKREVGHVCCNIGYIHLQKGEYEQAQVFFGRSLALAEQVGDTPLTSVVYSNLGILAARTGKLLEAEDWFRRGLGLAEQINDQVYVSMWNTLLSDVLQQQGKLPAAQTCLCHALKLGRRVGNIPCIGFALVASGNLRIAEARATSKRDNTTRRTRYLKRASNTLHHALSLEGLEAETRAEGQLAMAQVSLLLGNHDDALKQAEVVLAKVQAHELVWLVERTQELIGEIRVEDV